jgi:DNA repair protein RadC
MYRRKIKVMRIHDQPLEFRPRERLTKYGAENLTEEELLAIIISSGTRRKSAADLAKEVVKRFDENLLQTSVDELCSIKGMGRVTAMKLKAAFEVGLRYAKVFGDKVMINSSRDAYLVLQDFVHKRQEHLILITLNGRNQLISKKVITIGTLDASLFHPREIFAESIVDRASKIIVAHNHPSGNLDPSKNDLIMTDKVREAGELIGIQLVDSLIISGDGYRSIIQYEEK